MGKYPIITGLIIIFFCFIGGHSLFASQSEITLYTDIITHANIIDAKPIAQHDIQFANYLSDCPIIMEQERDKNQQLRPSGSNFNDKYTAFSLAFLYSIEEPESLLIAIAATRLYISNCTFLI